MHRLVMLTHVSMYVRLGDRKGMKEIERRKKRKGMKKGEQDERIVRRGDFRRVKTYTGMERKKICRFEGCLYL